MCHLFADLVSWGLRHCDLPNLRLWWHGPQFLEKIFSRRGKCAKLYSDNGKTFVGANKELKRFLKLIEDSDDNLAGFLSAEGIEWKFIPPRAPFFGGLWEASWLEHRNLDEKAWFGCPMSPNTIQVHTEYVLVKSVGPKVFWAEFTSAGGLENISLLFSSMPKLWRWRSVVSPSIVPSVISPS
ncbi:integrase catalytic domain-containing protein [Trichonephila clavipes]|nr:integrase catalytic domain-containing protein [Trichonephila clavipes]